MANYLENYGLDFFTEDEKAYMGLVSQIVSEGKAITGYYGTPYLFKPTGDSEFWLKTERNEEDELSVSEINIHCGGDCVWEVIHSGLDITPKKAPKTGRTIMVSRKDGKGGMVPVEILTADVLPSFLKGDVMNIQVVAQPLTIEYYANEEEYEEAQPKDENGKQWLIANGSLAPLSFLINHAPERYDPEIDYESDCYIQFTATVKKLYHGTFELGDQKFNTFIRCFAETEYGELEFDHTYEQVPEELRDNIEVGSIISGICILSGDVAIDEYENGIIKDFDHDLRLMRYTFVKGEAERLKSVLTEDAVYESEASGRSFVGPKEIIDRINDIHESASAEYYAHLAVLTETTDPEHPVGTRCIVLAYREEDNYISTAFISVNDEGMIEKLRVSNNPDFHFQIEAPEGRKTPLDDIPIPDSVFEPIILRAKFHDLIDQKVEPEEITENIPDYYLLQKNAQMMLDALQEKPQPDVEETFANLFGYLFAKAMEHAINENQKTVDDKMTLTASFRADEAFKGEITSTLPEAAHERLREAMELGKQFYNDFSFYVQMKNIREEAFVELFKSAAVVVQRIGQLCAEKYIFG